MGLAKGKGDPNLCFHLFIMLGSPCLDRKNGEIIIWIRCFWGLGYGECISFVPFFNEPLELDLMVLIIIGCNNYFISSLLLKSYFSL